MFFRACSAFYPRHSLVRAEPGLGRGDTGEGGFTLLEILVTIALIALLAGVLISGSAHLLSDRASSPEDTFRKAVNESRKAAVENNQEVRLVFDTKEKAFKASAAADMQTFPVTGPPDLTIEFLAAQKGGGAMLLGGEVVETQTIPYVTFYPDGTCSPFRVQLRATGTPLVIAIDPWTCAPVLESEKK